MTAPSPEAAAKAAARSGRLPLSVVMIALDEEARIGRALAAVEQLADDIVVVDSGSSDRTRAIAESHGARVFERAFDGYGPQKRHAEDLARNDWLLNLDADEEVSPALADEVRALFRNGPPPPAAYALWVLTVYPGERRPRPLARDYLIVRLYHRAAGRYRNHPLHDRVVLVPGVVAGRLRAPVWHHPVVSFEQMVEKANRFSSFQARSGRPRRRWTLLVRLPIEMPYWFVRTYFLRGHVTGGWKGFVFSLNQAFMRMLKIAKTLERMDAEAAARAPAAPSRVQRIRTP